MKKLLALAAVVALVLVASPCWPDIPHLINYQGMLTDDLGEPLSGSFDLTFRIFDELTGGNQEWGETQYEILVSNGLFSVNLGDSTPIDLPFDEDYWLEIEVEIYGGLSPRMKLTSVGYAYRAERADTTDHCLTALRADTADYALGADTAAYALAGGEGDNDWAFRITDTADTTLMTGGAWGLARSGNILYGNADSTHVNLGVACTTGLSGQDRKYCTIGGGVRNIASGLYSTVGGGMENKATGNESTVGGGRWNTASGWQGTVAGGYAGLASGESATVGGGWHNTANGIVSVVAGGQENTASGTYGTIGGGLSNSASGYYATVAGGYADTADGFSSFAAGDRVRLTSAADYTFAFGRNFTTSTSNAVIFHNSVSDIKVGIGTTSPVAILHVKGSGTPTAQVEETEPEMAAQVRLTNTARSWDVYADASPDIFSIHDVTNAADRLVIDNLGNVGIGTVSPTGQLDVNGNNIRIRTSQTPASSSADGYTGEIAWDASYIYICTSGDGPGGGTDSWKRANITTW